MPILWCYLLTHYLKVLIFCTLAFIALLLTLRLEEIAHFAALGPQGIYILYFTFYQIPYILPIALPIAALISSTILMKYLCRHSELTALRAAGLSLRTILLPLLFAAFFLAVANFYVVSELATNSHLASSLIKNELRSINPLLLLSNKHLMGLKGIYFDTLGPSQVGESASDSFIAMPDRNSKKINLLIAKQLRAIPAHFCCDRLTIISTSKAQNNKKDHLFIENINNTTTSIQDFTQMIQKKVWTLNNDHLRISLLLCRLKEDREYLKEAILLDKPISEQKQIQRSINRIYSEIARRISIAVAVITFTLLGVSCGISIGRNPSFLKIFLVIALSSIYVAAYFSAKNIDHLLIATVLFYAIPHLLILVTSFFLLRKTTKGIE